MSRYPATILYDRRARWGKCRLDTRTACDNAISHTWRLHADGLISWHHAARRDTLIRGRRARLPRTYLAVIDGGQL